MMFRDKKKKSFESFEENYFCKKLPVEEGLWTSKCPTCLLM